MSKKRMEIRTIDGGCIHLDCDLRPYKTAAGAAKAFHRALVKAGHNAQIERPIQSVARGTGYNWRVVWEEGPYQWACGQFIWGRWGYCEPYYSFDLCFNDDPMSEDQYIRRCEFDDARELPPCEEQA